MRQTILGRKLGMSQVFDRHGNAIPVTIIQAGPCTVLQVKTVESDGYNAIQLGFGDKKEKHTTKPLLGHFQKADSTPKRHIREARVDDPGIYKVGQVITVGQFEKEDRVDITGTSKGKGFAGVMKRHGFSGFMATHGVHESKRGPGSIGQSADPAKVFKGMRMPGQMGNETVTIQNLQIVDVRENQNLLMVKGPLPGGKNGLLTIRHAIKKEAPPLRQAEPEEEDQDMAEEVAADTPEEEVAAAPDSSAEAEEAKAKSAEDQVVEDEAAATEAAPEKAEPDPEPAEGETPPETGKSAEVETETEETPEDESEPEPAADSDDEGKEK